MKVPTRKAKMPSNWTLKNFGRAVNKNLIVFNEILEFASCSLSDIKKLLSRINDLPVGEAQMREFKKFTLLVSSANPQDQNEKIAKKLMKFYFEEKLNQPAKKCIQR